MNRLGFMQGRLTNKGGFYPQQFPIEAWEKEFETAARIGFDCIEWMFNFDQWERNPIINEEGIQKIRSLIDRTGVSVSGICANYFMHRCIYDSHAMEENIIILRRLIESAEALGCPYIIIPLFEASVARLEDETFELILESVSNKNVTILLETDCEMEATCEWIEKRNGKKAGLCYDMGNAAGLGRDIVKEMERYADIVKNVHIKDKKRQGTTVMLGQGDAGIREAVGVLCEKGYQGCFVLESYYSEDAIEDTKKNYVYVRDLFGR